MKTCEDCGCRVYEYGCIWCNEQDYIDAQDYDDRVITDGSEAERAVTRDVTSGDSRPRSFTEKKTEVRVMAPHVGGDPRLKELIATLQSQLRECRLVDFNERKQEFFCRVCRYRDPLGPDGNKLHDDNCPYLAVLRTHEELAALVAALDAVPPSAWQPIETYADDGLVLVWNGQPWVGYYQDPDGWFADVDGELLRIQPAPTVWTRLPGKDADACPRS